MSDRLRRLAAILIGVLVLAVAVGYAATRDATYESTATIVLAPAPDDPDIIPSLLDSFTRSGTLGTYVELLDSDDLARRARAGDVDVTVRSIPDTRAVQITATGAQRAVQPALERLIRQASAEEAGLRDPWELQVLESPSAAAEAGPSVQTVVLAGLAAAVLAALLAWVLVPSRQRQPLPRAPGREPDAAPEAESPSLLSELRGR